LVEYLPEGIGDRTMSRAKQASKRKRRSKAVPALGAAGLSLALASGASAATSGPAADMLARNTGVCHEITLDEEEIFDVSLATFHVFDKENAGAFRPGVKLAMGGGCEDDFGLGTNLFETPVARNLDASRPVPIEQDSRGERRQANGVGPTTAAPPRFPLKHE
jgi:hypothetical protein